MLAYRVYGLFFILNIRFSRDNVAVENLCANRFIFNLSNIRFSTFIYKKKTYLSATIRFDTSELFVFDITIKTKKY